MHYNNMPDIGALGAFDPPTHYAKVTYTRMTDNHSSHCFNTLELSKFQSCSTGTVCAGLLLLSLLPLSVSECGSEALSLLSATVSCRVSSTTTPTLRSSVHCSCLSTADESHALAVPSSTSANQAGYH